MSPPQPEPVEKFTWQQKVIRSSGLPASTRHVGLVLSVYADPDGSNAFPGVQNLMDDCGLSKRTILRALELLRAELLIERTYSRRQSGRRGLSDTYRLTMPSYLPDEQHPLSRSGLYRSQERVPLEHPESEEQ